jgi:hypothetical protein
LITAIRIEVVSRTVLIIISLMAGEAITSVICVSSF